MTSTAEPMQWKRCNKWDDESFDIRIDERIAALDASQLRDEIRSENRKARAAARKGLEHIRASGELLHALKSKTSHGWWRHELKTLGIEPRTASNHMRIAANWETVSHIGRGMKDALKLLTTPEDNSVLRDKHASASPLPSPAQHTQPPAIEVETEIVTDAAQPSVDVLDDVHVEAAPDSAFTEIMRLLPKLSKAEISDLIETLNTRWS